MALVEDEEALVQAWADGDAGASHRLIKLHGRAMLRVALALCHRPEDAEEAVQEAFLRALRAVPSFDPGRGSLRSWLVGVTANQARQFRRGATRYQNFLERIQRDPYRAEPAAMESSDLGFARKKLAALPAREREAFVLMEIEDLSSRDAAGVMGVSDSTVRVLAARARLRLQEKLGSIHASSVRAEGGR